MTVRRQENVSLSFRRNVLGSKGTAILTIGARRVVSLGKMQRAEFEAMQEQQRNYPLLLARVEERTY